MPSPPDEALREITFAESVARGERAAVERFEREYLEPLGRVLGSMRLDETTLEDVRQRVRERLLLPGDDGATRLVQYAGQGRLEGLVNVTATRIAVDLLRAQRQPGPADEAALFELADAAGDPAFLALRAQAQRAFRAAFETAVRALAPRERALLRLHLLRGVSLDKLAELYGVHRGTVVRWLAGARSEVHAGTRRELQRALSMAPAELDSLLGELDGALDASVERLFRTAP